MEGTIHITGNEYRYRIAAYVDRLGEFEQAFLSDRGIYIPEAALWKTVEKIVDDDRSIKIDIIYIETRDINGSPYFIREFQASGDINEKQKSVLKRFVARSNRNIHFLNESLLRYYKRLFSEHVHQNALDYPPTAKTLKQKGKVTVSFSVDQDGRVESIDLEESSGFEVLDRAAMDHIKKVAPFPKPPEHLAPYDCKISFNFKL
jgi:TonB family protein